MNDGTPIFLTDFTSMAKWTNLIEVIDAENAMGFKAYVKPISDKLFKNASTHKIASAAGDALVVFAVDLRALQAQEILCINTAEPNQIFRTHVRDLWIVENNLSTANMDFEEFMYSLDTNGVLESAV